jgi:uncharacterized protein (DUF2141 family)
VTREAFKYRPLLACVAFLSLSAATAPGGDSLTVEVNNVRVGKGIVHVDICPEALFLEEECPYKADAPAQIGLTRVTVHGVPAGRYAAQVFLDENRNGKVDRALFGIPKEGVGFSNDAPIRMSPPKWADAVFTYGGAAQTIRLNLRYFLGAKGPPEKK